MTFFCGGRTVVWGSCTMGIVLLLLGGCASQEHFTHAYRTGAGDCGRILGVIALTPVLLPVSLPRADDVRRNIDSMIFRKLSDAGYRVIAQEVCARTMQEMKPHPARGDGNVPGQDATGESDLWRRSCYPRLHEEWGATAFLTAEVMPVAAPFSGCTAAWDGAKQHVSKTLLGLFCDTANMRGRAAALTLVITLEDLQGDVLFFNGGGIQLTVQFVAKYPKGGQFEDIPEEDLLADDSLSLTAVDMALAPLLGVENSSI